MSLIVFSGPTIGPEGVRAELDAEAWPPAQRGDVLKAALQRPEAIGLIDGYFDRVPAVWHKEILWAMHEGVHVFGAASMGALRAAELVSFGMVGVGVIYEAFRDRTLMDDDEVAVAHAPEDLGYRSLSEAMVNVRATLRAAREAGVIHEDSRAAMEGIAKGLAYPDRSYPRILSRAVDAAISRSDVAALRDWLPGARVDQKREDATQMLRLMAAQHARGWRRKDVDYVFAHTDAWESLEREVMPRVLAGSDRLAAATVASDIAEELQVSGRARAAADGALARSVCLEQARRLQLKTDEPSLDAFVERFRRERGLFQPSEFQCWLEQQGLHDEDEITAYFDRELTFEKVKAWYAPESKAALADQLRGSGAYPALANRASAKRQLLSSRGMDRPELRDTRLSEEELWRWYFNDRLGRGVPANLELYVLAEGKTIEQLRSAVVREFVYLRLVASREKETWE